NAINIHEHSVNHPGHRQPFANTLIFLAAGCRAFIACRSARQHDKAMTGFHLRVPDSPIAFRQSGAFAEPELWQGSGGCKLLKTKTAEREGFDSSVAL